MLGDSHSAFQSLRSVARRNSSPSLWLQFAIACVIACLILRVVGKLNVVKPRALRTLSAYMWHRASRFVGIGPCFSVPRLPEHAVVDAPKQYL